jgi:hypothetical protein
MKSQKPLLYLLFILAAGFLTGCIDEIDDPFADPVDKFLGNWKATETSTLYGPGYVYDVTITRNTSNSVEILISNFYMQGVQERAKALVTGNTLTIVEQTICDGTITIEGSGKYVSEKIELTYTALDGADLDQVTAIFSRR